MTSNASSSLKITWIVEYEFLKANFLVGQLRSKMIPRNCILCLRKVSLSCLRTTATQENTYGFLANYQADICTIGRTPKYFNRTILKGKFDILCMKVGKFKSKCTRDERLQ